MSKPVIVKAWAFKSTSGRGTYQTLRYSNGCTSCDCPGWTRRVDALGKRSCKHTRSVDLGFADAEAESVKEYGTFQVQQTKEKTVITLKKDKANKDEPVRLFTFDD